MRRTALSLLLLLLFGLSARAEEAQVVAELPVISGQLFPWPVRGNVGRGHLAADGTVWLCTTLGEVVRLDWKKARENPRDPEAWKVFDLGEDLHLVAVTGHGKKVWVAGDIEGRRGVVFEWDGEAWRGVYLGDRTRCSRILDIAALGEDRVIAHGYADSAVVLRSSAGRWRELAPDDPEGPRLKSLLARDDRRWGELAVGDGVTDVQDVVAVGELLYAADYKARIHVREKGEWRSFPLGTPLALPHPAWTTVNLTKLDDRTVLVTGTRGMIVMLADGKRIDLSFGWRSSGRRVAHVPDGAEFCVAATQPIPRRRGADPGFVITANRKRIRVLRAPTTDEPGAIFARSEDDITLVTRRTGLVHAFDGKRWRPLTKEPLEPDWVRVGFPEDLASHHQPDFSVLHSPEPGVLFLAQPFFRCRDGKWEQLDLPFKPERHVREEQPGIFGPQGGRRRSWLTHTVTAILGESADDLRIETTKGDYRFDGKEFTWIHPEPGDWMRGGVPPNNPFHLVDEFWLRAQR